MTEASLEVLTKLRSFENMNWYVVPLLIFVIYVYAVEIEQKNYSAVLLGIIGFSGELIWEMFNASILHFTKYAPLWSTPGDSAFILYAGLNIEIATFFAVAPLIIVKLLPKDKSLKISGIPNRLLIPFLLGIACVAIEVALNKAGILIWSYKFWSWPHLYLIALVYISPWFLVVHAHDNISFNTKKLFALITPCAAVVCHIIFAVVLKWV